MREALPPRPAHGNWKDLYRAAILEKDSSVFDERISAAKKAIVARGSSTLDDWLRAESDVNNTGVPAA